MTPPDDTAIIERDLRAVDAALSDGSAVHDDPVARELQELALALRADSPLPERAFAEELGRRVEAGFPATPAARPARFRLPRVNLLPVAGVVAPLLLIVAVVLVIGGPENGSDEGGAGDGGGGGAVVAEGEGDGDGGETAAAPDASARQSGAGSAEALDEPPLPGTGFAPKRRQRRIERSIAMTLTAPDDEIPALADGVNRVTARNGGFVLRSELDTGDDGATGSYELRIPVNRLQSALRGLAGLGTVSSQSQSGQDVTRDFVTTADRLQAARAERRSLLRRLENAETDEQAEAIRVRLDLVAGEINGLRSQLRDLRLRTDYAIVSVDLIGEEGDSGSSGGAGSFDDAVGDAGDLLVGFAGVLIRVLAIALPLALIAALGWLASGMLRRRRRQSALA
jgi:Domain of unknown function (DUF4349)